MDKDKLKLRILNGGHRDDSFELYVKDLLENGRFDEGSAVIGIAKQIVTQGAPCLSEYQLTTFINHGIWDHYYIDECARCAHEIPWSEMEEAATGYGNCSYCQHKINKGE